MAETTQPATLRRSVEKARRFFEASLTCVLLGLLGAAPVQAMPVTFGDIEITPVPNPQPQGTSGHGYFEYLIYVVNKSSEQSHTVSLSIPFERGFAPYDSIRELRRTVQVGANEAVRVSLLQPDYPQLDGTGMAVSIDGRRQEREMHLALNQTRTSLGFGRRGAVYFGPGGMDEMLVLLGPHVKPLPVTDPPPGAGMMGGLPGMPAMKGPMRAPGAKGPSGMPGRTKPPRIEMPSGKPGLPSHGCQFVTATIWSDNWLAYSRYDGIIITAEELKALPEGARTALWQYVETGGALLVLGRTELRGLSAVAEAKDDKAGWLEVQAGFGICRVSLDANYDNWSANRFSDLVQDWRKVASVWQSEQRNTISANRDFPVIDDIGIPVKGLFVLMFLFVLGIGPVNVLVLSRLKRRIWLLWTTPVISLCTCMAVFGYMLISEGWWGRMRSDTLTLLDETTHRATTIGWTGVYSPLTPSDGLHFSYETEVVPQRYIEDRRSGGRSCSIDWSQDQHFASGWVEARVPVHFKVRKSELRRERVALQREADGRWSMVNGLGATIRQFWYADAKGQIHEAENIAPGARTMLAPTEKECQVQPKTMQSIFSNRGWTFAASQVTDFPQQLLRPNAYLRPGTYLAEVDDSPFLEIALQSARTRKLHALVMGFPSTSPER
jgi:hypothetical protein